MRKHRARSAAHNTHAARTSGVVLAAALIRRAIAHSDPGYSGLRLLRRMPGVTPLSVGVAAGVVLRWDIAHRAGA